MNDTTRTTDDTISLLDLIAVLARRKWLIVAMTAGIALFTVALILVMMAVPSTSPWNLLPVKFKPTAKVLVEDPTKGSTLSSIMSQSGLGALSGLVGGASGGKASSADLAKALLASNTLRDSIVREFDLATVWQLEKSKAPRTTARAAIAEATDAKFDEKSGILTVGYKDTDPERATRIVNRMVDLLDEEFKRLTVDRATMKREYLQSSVASYEIEARRVSDALIAFQNRHGIVDLDTQASENTRAIVQLQSQINAKQLEIDLQQKYLPEADSRIVKLKAEMAGLQKLLHAMKEGGTDLNNGGMSQKTIPALAVQFLNLKRDLEVAQTTLGMLKQQYEMARLEEMDTTAIFQIIEKAEVPEERFSPSRSKITVIATVAAFFVSVLVAFIVEYFRRAGSDPVEGEKLAAIRAQFSLRRGTSRR